MYSRGFFFWVAVQQAIAAALPADFLLPRSGIVCRRSVLVAVQRSLDCKVQGVGARDGRQEVRI